MSDQSKIITPQRILAGLTVGTGITGDLLGRIPNQTLVQRSVRDVANFTNEILTNFPDQPYLPKYEPRRVGGSPPGGGFPPSGGGFPPPYQPWLDFPTPANRPIIPSIPDGLDPLLPPPDLDSLIPVRPNYFPHTPNRNYGEIIGGSTAAGSAGGPAVALATLAVVALGAAAVFLYDKYKEKQEEKKQHEQWQKEAREKLEEYITEVQSQIQGLRSQQRSLFQKREEIPWVTVYAWLAGAVLCGIGGLASIFAAISQNSWLWLLVLLLLAAAGGLAFIWRIRFLAWKMVEDDLDKNVKELGQGIIKLEEHVKEAQQKLAEI